MLCSLICLISPHCPIYYYKIEGTSSKNSLFYCMTALFILWKLTRFPPRLKGKCIIIVNLFSTWCLTLIFTSVVMAGTSTSFPAFPFLVSLWSPPSVARGLRSQVGLPGCAGVTAGAGNPAVHGLASADLGFLSLPGLQLSSARSVSSFLHISFKTDFHFFLPPSPPAPMQLPWHSGFFHSWQMICPL